MWLYHEFVEETPIFKPTCWLFFITHHVSEGPVPSLLFLHSSHKWILPCINLVVTVVPKKPSDVSFAGKEDAHIVIFGYLGCKGVWTGEGHGHLPSPLGCSTGLLVGVTCCWLLFSVTAKLRIKISDSEITP